MQDSQLAPVERTPSTGFMSAFSTISENNFPSAPAECRAMASTPAIGPRPKAMTKISAYDAGNGAREFEETPDDEPQPWRGRRVLRGEEIQHKGNDRAGQGTDIADENGLA